MDKEVLFQIAAFLMVIPLTYLIFEIVKDYRKSGYEKEMLDLYEIYWNGTPDDELNAWYKVRRNLLMREESEKKLKFVDQKIQEVDKKNIIGKTLVNEQGELSNHDILPFSNV